jgi:PPOX class probable F420-dependent enzyme
MARRMTEEEYKSFLLDRARTAILATVRADGRPHAAPVWFDLDGDTLIFTTGENTVKGRNIRRDPRITICIDDDNPPFAFAVIEGQAEGAVKDSDLLYWTTRIGGRYMGSDRAEEYGTRNAVEDELLVRVTPRKIVAFTDLSG